MRKYKVLHVTNVLDLSGQQENTLYTVSYLDQSRFESHLAANLSTSDQNLDNILADRARAISHLKLHDLPHLRRMPSPFYDLWALYDLVRLMSAHRFDIVHTHATKAAMLARMAAKLAGVPIIVHSVHGWSFQYPAAPQWVLSFFLWLERVLARVTDRIVTVNRTLVDDGLNLRVGRPEQYLVVRSGMELEKFLDVKVDAAEKRASLGLPPAGPIVGTVMLFYRRKSPETIVQIAPKILEAVPDAHFLMVGDGEMMPEVKALVQQLGLQDRVILTGLRQDVPELMALMDVFVHPAWFEILPRAIVQAQATGTPVVATRLGGVPEVVKDGVTGLLVPAQDHAAMSEAIIRILTNPDLKASMARAARESVSAEYTVHAMVKAIEGVYNQLIESKVAPAAREQVRGTV